MKRYTELNAAGGCFLHAGSPALLVLLCAQSPFCSYATRDGVHVIMSGEVSEWPGGVDAVSACVWEGLRHERKSESWKLPAPLPCT